ncbi:HAMP domain-containing sensor histidine kinase [uncultured Desulfobacter sp.]|uniref:sensor histidine kinase n=1 Tax=uncultured Desulfobacter sp. TaxID=240139 RepID=UPI002AAB2FD9|nr:HAMP domain-containing sensor histidine kinase [uncultured Desulfobacter sp.]
MLNSLYSKIAAGLSVLFLVVGLIFLGVTVFATDMYQQEVNQKLNTGLARQIVKERILMEGGRVNQEALRDIFHMLMVINPGIEIYLLDVGGNILTFSAPGGSVKRSKVSLAPVKQWLDGTLTPPVLGDDPKNPTGKKVFSAAHIERNGILEGYLYVILGGEEYDSVAQKLKGSYILRLSAWMIGAGLLFALAAGLVLFGLLTGRLKKLAAVMAAFEGGSAGADVYLPGPQGPPDEIDRLGTTFREMAARIKAQVAELKASDQMRRELVANVSHDLRTPLATLQGYIETLLIKDNQYSGEERRHYLDIAIRHCRRLNTLVSELLELARLESARMDLSLEIFDPRELIQDICQKFTLAAEQKEIELVQEFEGGVPFVEADIALIERALENLIENALNYTPVKGRVGITVSLETEVVIRISDTGPGIPEKELPHIFNRFYQSDSLGKKTGGHTGLGLAITAKILQLHGRQVQVESRPGSGSCFSFSLPPWQRPQ